MDIFFVYGQSEQTSCATMWQYNYTLGCPEMFQVMNILKESKPPKKIQQICNVATRVFQKFNF